MSHLTKLRQEKGISQGELACKSGVSRTMITYLESGKSKCCNLKTIQKIAGVLGCEAIEILNGLCPDEKSRTIIGTTIVIWIGGC